MDDGVPSFTPPYRQTAPKEGQVEPATGRLSPKDMEILWKTLLEPAVVEFYPGQSQKDQQVRSMIDMMRGSDEGLRYFQRTHRTLFQDSKFRWRRMNVFKDTFLTTNMTLPTPNIPGMGTGIQETSLLSLPIRNLASSFYDIIRPDWTMSLESLELRWLPDLCEFTMACPKQCGDTMPSSDKGDTVATGDWHCGSPLDREGGEEDNSEKKGRHEWNELCLETRPDEPEMRKAWQVWQLTRVRFENPVRAKPVMLFSPTW
ncbi:hypothetical protein MRS44_004692 [Fusarium solani]|uniref:uncharacterized protein n=1 Tax=Fusarium solani TaxID=169388 RepID=UPI0032C45C70|nr:hypothetical protein MRS44_004692 [Fusarium solani]